MDPGSQSRSIPRARARSPARSAGDAPVRHRGRRSRVRAAARREQCDGPRHPAALPRRSGADGTDRPAGVDRRRAGGRAGRQRDRCGLLRPWHAPPGAGEADGHPTREPRDVEGAERLGFGPAVRFRLMLHGCRNGPRCRYLARRDRHASQLACHASAGVPGRAARRSCARSRSASLPRSWTIS